MSHELLDWLNSLKQSRIQLSLLKAYIEEYDLVPKAQLVIVTGTNGKGSTVEALSDLLLAQGQHVGKLISPHLHGFNERIQIDNQPIPTANLLIYLEQVRCTLPVTQYNYFVISFLVALYYFRSVTLDTIILEVGMGGRFDATNLLAADIAIITSIGLDHAATLGLTRETVAWNKVGLIRSEKNLIVGEPNPPILIEKMATALAVKQYQIQKDFGYLMMNNAWLFWSEQERLLLPKPRLLFSNVACALKATELLLGRLPQEQLVRTVKKMKLEGRFEVFDYHGTAVILDVAHNPAAVEVFKQQLGSEKVIVLLAGLQDKDVLGMIENLASHVRSWVVTSIDNPRAYSAPVLGELVRQNTRLPVVVMPETGEAFEYGLSLTQQSQQPCRLAVIGCFGLVDFVRTLIQKQMGINHAY